MRKWLLTDAVRVSLGKLMVNLLQVVKRTNTPLIPRHYGWGVPFGSFTVGRGQSHE